MNDHTETAPARNRVSRLWRIPVSILAAIIVALVYLARTPPAYIATAHLTLNAPATTQDATLPVSAFLHEEAERATSARVLAGALEVLDDPASSPDPVGWLRQRIRVRASPQTRLLHISADAPEPQRAAQLANAVATSYLARAGVELAEGDQRLTQLRQRRQQLLAELQQHQDDLQRFQKENPEFAAGDAVKQATSELARLAEAIYAARQELTTAQATLEATLPMLEDASKAADLIEANRSRNLFTSLDAEIARLRAELTQAQDLLNRQQAAMLPQNPALLATQKKVQELRQAIEQQQKRCVAIYRTTLEQQAAAAQLKLNDLETQAAHQKELLASVTARSSRYAQLAGALAAAEADLKALDQRLNDAQLTAGITGAAMTLVDSAQPPARPAWPDRTQVIGVALAAGLLLGLIAAGIRIG